MESADVAVIGGGPAGYSAALKAAELGARVVLIEAERPGGACVHHACIPTNIMLGSALAHLEARELSVMGVFEAGDAFHWARAAARKDALVRKLADGIAAALRMRKVQVIEGRAAFRDAHTLAISGQDDLWADAVIIATGTRWEPPGIPGVPADRVLTADAVQALPQPPASAVVLADGPADTAFGLEYATLLALAGSEVTAVSPRESMLPALDPDVAAFVRGSLEATGIRVLEGASIRGEGESGIRFETAAGSEVVPAEIVVAADPRRPFFDTLGLAAAGVATADGIPVGRDCRTNVPNIFAAGDVTGGAMLTHAATHMGEVAAANATGGDERTRLAALPHLLHLVPEAGWVGLSEPAARALGHDVRTGAFDLSYNARAVVLGAREGIVKVVADSESGQVLGVHAAGPAASEILAVASTVIQSELLLEDLAALVAWHPGTTEALIEAARRAR
ncbi:MAG: dihydrolipoyl dehydrogenase family protein [Hyphomicrobiales bacterium]